MKSEEIVAALGLPPSAQVNQRVPKKLLLENGAPTAADRRHSNRGIEEFLWLAALKSNTIGVPEYQDEVREYLEIAVLRLVLRPKAKVARLVELVHRAVPYPVLLLTDCDGISTLSAAHKRNSQAEAGQVVLDGPVIEVTGEDCREHPEFVNALGLRQQPKTSMLTLYQGWVDALLSLQAATITGIFAMPSTREQAEARAVALREYGRLEAEIDRLQRAAAKEKQISRHVDLNLKIRSLKSTQTTVYEEL